ncbi:MAG: AMP-binding protein [Clostridia bacterium]|nr:AMP-binding protein [Clostridia bacterium]
MTKKLRYYDSKRIENLRSVLRAAERQYGSRPAFMQKTDGIYRPTTYSEFGDMVEGLGTELLSQDMLGSRIIVMGDNCLEWATVYMTVVCGLGVIVPADKEMPPEELQNIAEVSNARAIFYSPRFKNKVLSLPDTVRKIAFPDIYPLINEGRKKLEWGDTSFLRLPIDRDALAVLLFTSGTTGMSKGVMLSHKNICSNLTEIGFMLYSDSSDILLTVLPLHHAYACTCSFLFPMTRGACVAFCEGLRYITRNMQEIHPTVICCVPILVETIYRKIRINISRKGIEKKMQTAVSLTGGNMALKRRVFSEIHDSLGGNLRLIICGGAAADPAVLRGLRDFGLRTIQGYGLTECSPIAAINKDDYFRDDAAGLPTPGTVVDIYDVQNDGTGEIRVKSDGVMLGYYEDPERTAEVIRDGWFYTGDLGYIDNDGFLHITGRKKNVIVTAGGKNVFPEELETYLCRNRFVSEAVVVGYINETRGDYDIVAVLHPDTAAFTEVYGREYSHGQVEAEFARAVEEVNSLVQPYKRINFFVIRTEEFERTSSRKIRRMGVAEAAQAEYLRRLARS